jgi:rhodanese-related sulfurtransferase
MNSARNLILKIGGVIAFSTILALMVNGIRGEGLPLVMPFTPEYQCPSRMPEGLAIRMEEALGLYGRGQALFVDARSRDSFDKNHITGAVSLPYSFLAPVPADAVAGLKQGRSVIVYCNGKGAERSRLMAGELSDAGLKGVSYLDGGLLGWVKAQGAHTGQKPEDYE